MADQTINQLTTVAGEAVDRAADKIALWDNSASATKGLLAQDVVTTGVQDPTGATTTRVNKIVALTQAAYDLIGTPDAQSLYVITDGQSDAEAINSILQLSTDFADFKSRMNTAFGS